MSLSDARALSVLTIAGSDSGGGAGIQADLKTFAAHGLHGLSAIAALTAQHTRGVTAVHVPPVAFLRAQIDACFDDFRIGAVKLGMLANKQVIDAVADALERHRPAFIVLDPVMVATSGARLLEPDALDALRTRLFPLATILTPNIPEAELLLGQRIDDDAAAEAALEALRALGTQALLLKGGHLRSAGAMVDRYCDAEPRVSGSHTSESMSRGMVPAARSRRRSRRICASVSPCMPHAKPPPTMCMAPCGMRSVPGAARSRS